MKYLIVILVVVVAGWLLLRSRSRDLPAKRGTAPDSQPQTMVQCRHCGVHLPRVDALLDHRGAFCTQAHRLAGPRER
ncbi:MAG: PP0621 family protein [Rubrivivax sp.]